MRSTHSMGLDVLGADAGEVIVVRVKNAPELARSQGPVASFAQSIAPATIEHKVLTTIAQKLRESFSAQKPAVDVDVTVAEPTAWKPTGTSHIWIDVGIGLGGLAVVALLWSFFSHGGRHGRRMLEGRPRRVALKAPAHALPARARHQLAASSTAFPRVAIPAASTRALSHA